MRTALLAPLALALTASAAQADVTITVNGTVSVDNYNFGPYQTASVGDAVAVTFTVATPGTIVTPGTEVDYVVDSASFSVDIAGPLTGTPSGSPVLTVENDNPDDGFSLVAPLTNGDNFGLQFTAASSMLASPTLENETGTYDLTTLITMQNMRFNGAGGFLGITAETLTIEAPGAVYCIELTGEVLSNSYSSGALAGATAGDTAVLRYCVSTPGVAIAPGQLVNYPIDLSTFDFDVNGSTGIVPANPTNLQVQNDFPVSDGFRINQTVLATGEFFESGFGAVGTLFSSVDISQLVGTYDVSANLTSFGYVIQGGGGSMEIFPETLSISLPPVGTAYCNPNNANSTGAPGVLSATGSDVAADNDLTLTVTGLPTGSFGFFLAGQTQDLVLNPGGSEGNLCLGGMIGRYVGAGQIQNSGAAGEISLALDLTATPQPNGFVSIASGDTWNFQAWYRDTNMGTSVSNLTSALSVTFQ